MFAGLMVAAASVFWLLWWFAGPSEKANDLPDAPAVILFRNGRLCDMTAKARTYLGDQVTTIAALDEFLSDAFPGLSIGDETEEPFDRESELIECRLQVRRNGGSLRVEIWGLKAIAAARHEQSLSLLDTIKQHAPLLVWQQTDDGQVVWSNAAYGDLVGTLGEGQTEVFPDLSAKSPARELRLQPMGQTNHWFDVTTQREGTHLTCFASETTELVRADKSRREYVKTLGRTFADLSIGLAIFGKDRQLQMFNPALLEMSKLPFAFLSARPRLETFFDRLRELQMTPEPKDYASWREQFLAVEADAKQGTYCENWPLPDGQTFRVTGRPHPDGDFALLFEDITAEVSLTRRFRTEIETGQAVLDSLPDGIAVFSQTGTLVMTNHAYGAIWGCDDIQFSHRDLTTELAHWQENAVTTGIWNDIRDIAQHSSERKAWAGDTLLLDGRPLRCHVTPLDGGMTLIRFASAAIAKSVVSKVTFPAPEIRARSR